MPLRHLLLAVAVAAIWGLNFVIIRIGLDSFPPILFSGLRFLVSSLPLLWLWRAGPPAPWAYLIGIGLALGVAKFSLLFIGIDIGMPPGLASLVLQMQAFATVILAILLLGERPRASQLLGMAVAAAGIVLIAVDLGLWTGGGTSLAGLGLVLAAAVFWGLSNILTRQARARDPLALMVWVSAVAWPPLLLVSGIAEGPAAMGQALAGLDWAGLGALAYISVVATLVGFGAWSFLLHTYSASVVAPFSLLVPVFGMTSAALLLGESFSWLKVAACLVVLAGLALVVLKPRAPVPARVGS